MKMTKNLELYLNCLNDSRFDNYNEWLKIGAIIYNENCSFDLFDKYSKKSEKYSGVEECKKKWESYSSDRDKIATMKSLIIMAKHDNYKKFLNSLLKDPESIIDEMFIYDIDDILCAYLFYSLNQKKNK